MLITATTMIKTAKIMIMNSITIMKLLLMSQFDHHHHYHRKHSHFHINKNEQKITLITTKIMIRIQLTKRLISVK